MKAIVLTAGHGKRLEALTRYASKAMIDFHGKPLLAKLLKNLGDIGFNDLAVVINPEHRDVKDKFRYDQTGSLPSITWIEQTEGAGIGNAVLSARDYIDEKDYFLLAYGDIMFNGNLFQSLQNSFNALQKPVAVVSLTNESGNFGMIYMDQEMKITEIIQKPPEEKLGNYILAGAFILPGKMLSLLANSCGSMADAFNLLLTETELYASIWEDDWIDIAYPWSILTANQMSMKNWSKSIQSASITIESGVNISGPVHIEDDVIIKAGATIIGPCYIGRNSFIGHNALLREYTSIGSDCIIGFGVEVKNSVIMSETEIGRLSFVGDSVIGKNVEVGSATIMVNVKKDQTAVGVEIDGKTIDSGLKKLGSFIGDNAWIGANHTFLPGTKIPADKVISHFGTHPKNS